MCCLHSAVSAGLALLLVHIHDTWASRLFTFAFDRSSFWYWEINSLQYSAMNLDNDLVVEVSGQTAWVLTPRNWPSIPVWLICFLRPHWNDLGNLSHLIALVSLGCWQDSTRQQQRWVSKNTISFNIFFSSGNRMRCVRVALLCANRIWRLPLVPPCNVSL